MSNARNMPPVDAGSSEQNAFVQDWLSAWLKKFPAADVDVNEDNDLGIHFTIEAIQGTYNYKEDPNART